MFEQTMLSSADASRRAWTTGVGFAGQIAVVGLIAAIPMIWPEAMPKPQALLLLLTPPAPVAPAHVTAVKPRSTQPSQARVYLDPTRIPSAIPNKVAMIDDGPPDVPGAIPGAIAGAGGDVSWLAGIVGGVKAASPPPHEVKHVDLPKPAEAPSAPPRIRTSSLEMARVIRQVQPVYPQVAKMARVEGAVELTGVIGIDGHIKELKALSGNPLLIRAAIDAVSQWIYAPPVLNGVRVEVIAPITVNFRLDR